VAWGTVGKVAAGILTVAVVPLMLSRIAQVSGDRQKEADARGKLLTTFDQAVTGTVTESRLFAVGLLVASAQVGPGASDTSPESATAYATTLNNWLDVSSELGDEVNSYFGDAPCPDPPPPLSATGRADRVRCDWIYLFSAVTDFLRLSAHVERFDTATANAARERLQTTLAALDPSSTMIDWTAMATSGSASDWVATVGDVSDSLLRARDQYAKDVRGSRANGYALRYVYLP
jgi:hypothetical protein